MATRTYELTLTGLPVPAGEIDVRDLVAILEPLRLAALRVARQVGGSAPTGRTASSLDDAGGLRFMATKAGSTVLEFALGDASSLPGMQDEALIADRFEELVGAVASNDPPEWATPPIAAACRKAAAAIHSCGATSFRLTRVGNATRPVAEAETVDLDSGIWAVKPEDAGIMTVSGRLDMVDLREGHFRVRDDIGNDIHLVDVADADLASTLVGQRVVASGSAERDHRRRLRLVAPTISADTLSVPWTQVPTALPAASIALADIPGVDVTADEVGEFIKVIRS